MGSFTRVQRRILATGGIRVSMRRMVSLTYAANALSETLPAGVALSSAYTFQRMRVWGASAPLAGFTLLATGVLSTVSGVLVRWVSRHQRPALIRAVERALRTVLGREPVGSTAGEARRSAVGCPAHRRGHDKAPWCLTQPKLARGSLTHGALSRSVPTPTLASRRLLL